MNARTSYLLVHAILTALLIPLTSSAQQLKIGVIESLTGEAASFGECEQAAITLALEKLPAEDRARIKVFTEDDMLDPKMTVSAYRALRTKHDVDVILNFSSSTSKAIAPIVEQDQIPMIAVATDPKIVEGRKWVVNFWVTPEEEARKTVNYLRKKGYKKVARITTIQDAYLSLKNHFDRLAQGNPEVPLSEDFPLADKDFRPFLIKAKARNDIDALMILCMPGHVGLAAKQARQLGLTLPFFGIESLEDPNEVKVSEGALIGAEYVIADTPNSDFMKEFEQRFPGVSTFWAGNTYDAIFLLAQAAKINPSREAVNAFLHNVKDFSGVMGTFSASGDNRFTLGAAVKRVTPNSFEKVE